MPVSTLCRPHRKMHSRGANNFDTPVPSVAYSSPSLSQYKCHSLSLTWWQVCMYCAASVWLSLCSPSRWGCLLVSERQLKCVC